MIKFLGAAGLVAAGLFAGMTSMAAAEDTILVSMKGPGAGNPCGAAGQGGAGEKGAGVGGDGNRCRHRRTGEFTGR